MFLLKNKYFLIIQNTKDLNLKNIKKYNKFIIIYRNKNNDENITQIKEFRKKCKLKSIKFYVANNKDLAIKINADGLYMSAHNRSLKSLFLKKNNFNIIGSAHNMKEIVFKKNQGCSYILLSKLFLVNYDKKKSFLGTIKFNRISKNTSKIIALGGIKSQNLNSIRNVNCDGIAILSEVKKKPAIISRLF